jgi:hypothetical protein
MGSKVAAKSIQDTQSEDFAVEQKGIELEALLVQGIVERLYHTSVLFDATCTTYLEVGST